MSESTIQREIMLAVSREGHHIFRNNVAEGWIGQSLGPLREGAHLFVRSGSVVIENARRLRSGLCIGSSDLCGWSANGRFLAIEVKSRTGRLTKEQENFINQVRKAGGIGLCCRSVDEALEGLK